MKLLHNAPQIEIFGVGSSKLAAIDCYQKLISVGKTVNFFTDVHVATTQLVNLPAKSVLIIISNSGKTIEDIDLLGIAQKMHIASIILTADVKAKAAQLASIILPTQSVGEPKLRSGAITSLISQLFVVDSLLFSYISRYPNGILDRLKSSRRAIKKYKVKNRYK